jgi:predicted peptidase
MNTNAALIQKNARSPIRFQKDAKDEHRKNFSSSTIMKTLIATLIMVGLGCSTFAQSAKKNLTAHAFSWQVSHNGILKYELYLPEGYTNQSSARWPLMLFLHGIGERGTNLSKILVHGPIMLANEGHSFPFIIVAPQCPDDEFWDNTEALIKLLDHVEKTYRVDLTRVYLTGLSMGGYGAWKLGTTYPARFAAMIPVSGGGELLNIRFANPDRMKALKTLGVWAFHGARDNVVPVTESERSVNLLKSIGNTDVKLTIYPNAQHDAWTKTYANPEVYEWLLQHRRTNAVPAK